MEYSSQNLSASRGDENAATLPSMDAYVSYFQSLAMLLRYLSRCYKETAEKSLESRSIEQFFDRLLATIEALRIKYAFSASAERPLWVDPTSSGFPNFMEFQHVTQDLLTKQERMTTLPPKAMLKSEMLGHMLTRHEEPKASLWKLAERTYLEMLDEARMFLPFTPGELVLMKTREKFRAYAFTWGCFDFATNRPYIHTMTFDQDVDREPLELNGAAWHEFLEVVRGEGARAPDIGILAVAIDQALDYVHPKVLKRLCVGPLFTRQLAELSDPSQLPDTEQRYITELLLQHGRANADAVLCATEETIISKSQQVTRSMLSPRGKLREVFAITETDPECYRRKASIVQHRVIMPHALLQLLASRESTIELAMLDVCNKVTYDTQGGIVIHGNT